MRERAAPSPFTSMQFKKLSYQPANPAYGLGPSWTPPINQAPFGAFKPVPFVPTRTTVQGAGFSATSVSPYPSLLPPGEYGPVNWRDEFDQAIRYTNRVQVSRPSFSRRSAPRVRGGRPTSMRNPYRYYLQTLPWLARAGAWAWANKGSLFAATQLLAEMYRARATGPGGVAVSQGGTAIQIPSTGEGVPRAYRDASPAMRAAVDRQIELLITQVIEARRAGVGPDLLDAAEWADKLDNPFVADPAMDAGLSTLDAFKAGWHSDALKNAVTGQLRNAAVKGALSSVGLGALASAAIPIVGVVSFLRSRSKRKQADRKISEARRIVQELEEGKTITNNELRLLQLVMREAGSFDLLPPELKIDVGPIPLLMHQVKIRAGHSAKRSEAVPNTRKTAVGSRFLLHKAGSVAESILRGAGVYDPAGETYRKPISLQVLPPAPTLCPPAEAAPIVSAPAVVAASDPVVRQPTVVPVGLEPQPIQFFLPNGTAFTVPTEDEPTARAVAELVIAEYNRRALARLGRGGLSNLGDSVIGASSFMAPVISPDAIYREGGYHDGHPTGERARCHDSGGVPFVRYSSDARVGEFYRSNMFKAELKPMRTGLYGQIRLDAMPFKVEINSNVVNSRAKLAMIHEFMHGLNELLKLGMNHQQLHLFSNYLLTEVVPGYLALEAALPKE